MWPHPISIGLGGKAISIGTDSPEVVAALDPWRILDVGGPTDYCLELDPPAPQGAKTRPLPGLYHGSRTLLRSREPERLTSVLFRVLGAHARPAGAGQIRIALMPVAFNGTALLAPPDSISAVPDRWITSQNIEALYTVSSLVDVNENRILIDPPLGSDEDQGSQAIGGWWLPPSSAQAAQSPGFAVAEAIKLVADVDVTNASSVLQAVAALVERARPVVAPRTVDETKELLTEALRRAAPR